MVDLNQIYSGEHTEQEHLTTYEWLIDEFRHGRMPKATEFFHSIAIDHLAEDPEYYTKLQRAGL